jgi:ABC-type glutathione transport system ATPase component
MTQPILETINVAKHFGGGRNLFARAPLIRAVDGISLKVMAGETFAIVGESGCGKSTLGRLLVRLLTPSAGTVRYAGQDVAEIGGSAMRRIRRELQFVFQDPFASLNPRMTLGEIVGEPLWLDGVAKGERKERVADLLATVGLPPAGIDRYPHEFSGGQRQRIAIARALAGGPKVVIGDEPVSALDVSIQAQIINLLEDLKERFGLTLVIVAHDLAVIRHMSERVAVM